jgi:hypothetical protein
MEECGHLNVSLLSACSENTGRVKCLDRTPSRFFD